MTQRRNRLKATLTGSLRSALTRPRRRVKRDYMNGEGKLRIKLVRTGNPSYDWHSFNGQVRAITSLWSQLSQRRCMSCHARAGANRSDPSAAR